MKEFTLNGKKYQAKEFDFNLICDLEDIGVHLDQVASKPLSMMRAYFSLCSGLSADKAGEEIAEHLKNGGNMDELGGVIGKQVEESDFFRSFNQQEKKEKK